MPKATMRWANVTAAIQGFLVATADATEIAASSENHSLQRIGIVVIGRNEGERLNRCLASLKVGACPVAYVDSGSTDGSVVLAKGQGVDVVALDMRIPFTAARARNAGFERLRQIAPTLQLVQFVDGDCELSPDWLRAAGDFLAQHPHVVVVAGRLHEKHPDASVYNMLCDMEWDAPVGESKVCGGIAMMRADEFAAVHGFNVTLICGEEPELCARLRAEGGKVWRIADDMAWHDANITRFQQWWSRTVRSGYSFAQASQSGAESKDRRGVRESQRIWFWSVGLPLASIALALFWLPAGLLLLLAYPLQITRLTLNGPRSFKANLLKASFLLLGKFPELQGQIRYHIERRMGRQSALIEHK